MLNRQFTSTLLEIVAIDERNEPKFDFLGFLALSIPTEKSWAIAVPVLLKEPVFIPLGCLSTVSEISKWCNMAWIFSNSQGDFLVSFLCQFFHLVLFILSFWNSYWITVGLLRPIPLFILIIFSVLGIFVF